MPTTTLHRCILFFLLVFVDFHIGSPIKSAATGGADPNGDAHDVLPEYGLPKGLLPGNVVSYTKSDDGQFTVELSEPCYAQFSELASFSKTIKGKLTYGVISDLTGIQVRKFLFWLPVTHVEAGNGGGNIRFDAGRFSETHSTSEFQNIRECKRRDSIAATADA